MKKYEGKKILITGSCGTVGAEILRQLSLINVSEIVCLDNNETELFFQQEAYKKEEKVRCHLCDIRDLKSISSRMKGVDIVIHTAALKHVGLCEDSPSQAVYTNIIGTQNVIDAAISHNVSRVIFTSSDKAVNPTNVMGTSKLMGERLMTAADQASTLAYDDQEVGKKTIFASTRFGNVLGSRGSVIPLFRNQIASGGPITLTCETMTRFVMSLEDAAALVLDSVWLAHGGEVFVTKMPVANIGDVAQIMRKRLGPLLCPDKPIDIVTIGPKPGEKLYEELMNDEEIRRTWELDEFFVILSAFEESSNYSHLAEFPQPDRPYHSGNESVMSEQDCENYLSERGFFDD